MKAYSWRSYSFLAMSIIVSLSFLFLLYTTTAYNKWILPFVLAIIVLGAVFSLIMLFLTLFNKKEKKMIAIFASIITILNTALIVFVLWLMMVYPWWFFGGFAHVKDSADIIVGVA
ncbi:MULTISPECIES: hypothetical protein [Gracilibacillus]|uniref:hypothetical protein n=1 Tax=Gracilibacillus TaxID=74385 RepID=UPI0008251780|nr:MULTISPECIES: hypothetical protein [Gracilibacillus]